MLDLDADDLVPAEGESNLAVGVDRAAMRFRPVEGRSGLDVIGIGKDLSADFDLLFVVPGLRHRMKVLQAPFHDRQVPGPFRRFERACLFVVAQ